MNKISVIIPVYNAEKYLSQCLSSVENQTLKDVEVIMINDGSKDHSLEIMQSYYSKIPNLNIINTINYGAGHARNIGLDLATGEYVKFLDADDCFPKKDILEKLYTISSYYDIDVLVGRYYTHFGRVNVSGFYNTLGQEKTGIVDLEQNKNYPFEEMPGIGDKIFKREFIGDIRFSEKRWEDLAFTPVLMADAKRLYFLDEVVYNYRMTIHNTSLNGCFHASNIFEFFDVYNDLKENFKKRKIFEKYKNELQELFSMHGHFDASYVPLWIDMDLEEKRNLLKYFITKLEIEYPLFREDQIVKNYYASHFMFLKLFQYAEKMSKKSQINTYPSNENIEKFISSCKVFQKK